jgi:hypothetical protein
MAACFKPFLTACPVSRHRCFVFHIIRRGNYVVRIFCVLCFCGLFLYCGGYRGRRGYNQHQSGGLKNMKTTLNKIREHSPRKNGWEKLLTTLGKTKADDDPLDLLTILDSNGLDDTLWCLRAVDGHDAEIRKLACAYALMVADLWDMPEVVREYLETQKEELRNAAWAAAWDAAGAAAGDAARAAARDAAWDAAGDAARAAARAAAWDAQTKMLLDVLKED